MYKQVYGKNRGSTTAKGRWLARGVETLMWQVSRNLVSLYMHGHFADSNAEVCPASWSPCSWADLPRMSCWDVVFSPLPHLASQYPGLRVAYMDTNSGGENLSTCTGRSSLQITFPTKSAWHAALRRVLQPSVKLWAQVLAAVARRGSGVCLCAALAPSPAARTPPVRRSTGQCLHDRVSSWLPQSCITPGSCLLVAFLFTQAVCCLLHVTSNKLRIAYCRVRLPVNPESGRGVVLGEGKPENQNHAIIFCFNETLQAIDMNQVHSLQIRQKTCTCMDSNQCAQIAFSAQGGL